MVVIPVYNHPATIRAVAESVAAVHPDVLVVDDGSDRDCRELLRGVPVLVERHEPNRGKGAAIMAGAREAARLGFTHIITIDADGQHHAEDLPLFFEAIKREPNAIHVGMRDFSVANVPGASVFGRKFSNFWLRVQTGKGLGDVQSGFRAYPLFALLGLPLHETRFAFEVEVLVKAAWAGVDLKDVNIGVTYQPPGVRVSHFDKFRDNVRLSVLNTRLTMRSMLPWHRRRIVTGLDGRAEVTLLHPIRSLKGMLLENATPTTIALSAALGVFIGALPLVSVQTVTLLALVGYFGLNRVVGIVSAQLCTPPFVPALCVEAGYFMRNGGFLTEFTMETLGRQAWQRIWEWVLGSLVVAPLLAVTFGLAVFAAAHLVRRAARG